MALRSPLAPWFLQEVQTAAEWVVLEVAYGRSDTNTSPPLLLSLMQRWQMAAPLTAIHKSESSPQ